MVASSFQFTVVVLVLVVAVVVSAFVPVALIPKSSHMTLRESYDGVPGGTTGRVETLEFKIFPDGSVEEVVRGIKGNQCSKVTESINEALGKVISTQPTEEMYEQELVVDQTLTQSVDNGGGSDWEGSSSW